MGSSMKKSWEHYSHTADMGIRGFGGTLEEAFASAALAMVAISVDLRKIEPKQQVDVTCEQPDRELLLIDWLNALIYEMAVRKMIFGRFEVKIEGECLIGKVWGEKLDMKKHRPAVEIKGTSYSDLKVARENEQWVAQCIIDI
jgi:SHS2 domain-containing protein